MDANNPMGYDTLDGRGSYTRFEATGEENWVSRGSHYQDARN